LLECAAATIDGGCSALIDAAFLEPGQREPFRLLARERRLPFLIVSCTASPALLAARLDARARDRQDPSEATRDVLEHQLAQARALAADEQLQSVEIDMGREPSLEPVLDRIRARPGTS
jgi:predicted kinase